MKSGVYYYGYRTVDPIYTDEPYKSCIYKGVVYHWNTTSTRQIEVYRSWLTFSSPVDAINDARDWITNAPLDVIMTPREDRRIESEVSQ